MHLAFRIVVRPTHTSDIAVVPEPPSRHDEFGWRRVVLNDRTTPKAEDLSEGRGVIKNPHQEWKADDKNLPMAHALKFNRLTISNSKFGNIDDEFGVFARLRFDADPTFMLLDDDFETHRKSQAGSGARRLGRKEGLEDSFLDLIRNSIAI